MPTVEEILGNLALGPPGPKAEVAAPLIAFVGDSITRATLQPNTATLTANGNFGHSFWIPALTKQRVRTTQALNFGVAGETSTQIRARIGTVAASVAGIIVLHCGTNDLNGGATGSTLTTYAANMTAMIDTLLYAGKMVIAVPIAPRDLAGANERQMLWQMNRWLRGQQWSGRRNFYVVDIAAQFGDPLSATGAPKASTTYDGLHPEASGAFALAKPIADLLNALYPAYNDAAMASVADIYNATYNPRGNLLANGILDGTAGTLGSNGGGTFTGQIANNHSADVLQNGGTLTNLVVTASKGTDADGRPYQQFVLSGTFVGGWESAVVTRELPANYSSYAIGDKVIAELEYELVGQSAFQQISGISCFLHMTMGGTSYSVEDGRTGGIGSRMAKDGYSAGLRTPELAISAVPTLIQCGAKIYLRQEGSNTLTANSTVRFKGLSLRKVIP